MFDILSVHYHILIVLVLINIPIYWMLYKLLFYDFDEFSNAFVFWLTPAQTWENKDWLTELWAVQKLLIWFSTPILAVIAEYWLLDFFLEHDMFG